MVALKNHQRSNQYNIRLLLAEREPNTTSSSLASTLLLFPTLAYLDLSYTTSARDRAVLCSLSQLEYLQVLKLRGIGLKDNDAEFLANAIGHRVRYLDLRDNLLTDMAVRSLMEASFLPPNSRAQPRPRRTGTSPDPVSQSILHGSGSDLFKRPDLDEQFMRLLAQPISYHPWVEDLPHTGITHLYITGNLISIEGVASLLASSRLHALDFGTLKTPDVARKVLKFGEKYPGAEKLVPLLGKVAGDNLIYFRAHHAVLTAEPPCKDAASTAEFLPELSTQENHIESDDAEVSEAAELDAAQQINELSEETRAIYELADTSIDDSVTSAPDLPHIQEPTTKDEEPQLPKRGPAFAPEVVHPIPMRSANGNNMLGRSETVISFSETTGGDTLSSVSTSEYMLATSSSLQTLQCSSPTSTDDTRGQRIQELLAKRPRNQSIPLQGGKESRFPYLHPSHIPHTETLVLTDVPSHVAPNSSIIPALIRFITACSNEFLLATLQAGSDYSLPPGQARMRAEQQRSRSLFGLRRLVLEITPVDTKLTSWKPGNQYNATGHSSTGDRDSENLWSAAVNDYSFFGEEECGVPENDPGKYFPMAVLNEKVSLMPDDDSALSPDSPRLGRHPSQRNAHSLSQPGKSEKDKQIQSLDLVAEVAAFRRAKKAEYEAVVRRERGRRSTFGSNASSLSPSAPPVSLTTFVEGHWKGEVKVVRNPKPNMRTGIVDMYGNYFEKGYLYP
ncbi:uncharacterized protein N7511_009905 [Penicillium nucicola]|uniref:uncharacterized protein n=1 Tax=Penicillium nucicola TaxID=1850975 RepID=UPI00254522E2|nr:uncharacterized protein N7511_009905 [Penicillium nucicola]KAJ5748209.1 hypothetical protein N7511_009905 [Penicillium nucicola]